MVRMWQDFRGGTDGQPVTRETMDPGGTVASFIVIDDVSGTGPDISYSTGVGQRFGYPMGVQVRWAGEPTYLRWDEPEPDVAARNVMRFPVVFDSIPAVFTPYAQMRNIGGGLMGQVGVDTSGRIYVDQMAAAERFQASPGVIYWVELAVTAGTTAADGVVEIRVQDAGQAVVFEWSTLAADTGTEPLQHYRVGGPGTDSSVTADFLIPTAGLVMGDLESGWWPHLSPDNINIRPLSAMRVGPNEEVDVQAVLWDGSAADSWTWEQTTGPDLLLNGDGPVGSIRGPDVWGPGMPVPSPGERAALSVAEVRVTATQGSEESPPVDFRVEIVPQLMWTRAAGVGWTGGTYAPVCEEAL